MLHFQNIYGAKKIIIKNEMHIYEKLDKCFEIDSTFLIRKYKFWG